MNIILGLKSKPLSIAKLVQKYLLSIIMPKITAQGMKSPVKDFFNKCDQMRSFLKIWSHLLKKSLIENCIVFLLGLSKIFPPKESLVSFSNRYVQ